MQYFRVLLSIYIGCLISANTAQAFQAGCTYQVRPASAVLSPLGTSDPYYGFMLLDVVTSSSCAWTATTSAGWVHLGDPSSGTGPGTVFYFTDPNPNSSSRTATVQVGGATHTVTQAGGVSGCTYALAPTTSSVPAAGGNVTLTITATSGCFWGVDAFPNWVRSAELPTGMGSGTLVLTVAANEQTQPRIGTLTIAGRSHTITQAGTGGTPCTYSIAPASASIPTAGGNGTVAVTAGSGCSWTAASNAAWLTVTSGATGTGNGTVGYAAAVNTSTSARSGTLTVAGQTFTANQAAAVVSGPPSITSSGIVNTADYTANFAPGGIISIFGANLARSIQVAGPPPLTTSLDGTSVEAILGGSTTVSLPLFFVSPDQINAQLPFTAPLGTIELRVRTALGLSGTEAIVIGSRSPRLFTVPAGGKGPAALLHGNYQAVSANAPGTPGEWLVLYLTGLGAVSPAVKEGQPGGNGGNLGPLNKTTAEVSVTVGGLTADVYFAGLAPGFAGLYQVNFKVPDNAAQGVPEIVVAVEGRSSQRGVTFQTSFQWSEATAKNIGPEGGAITHGEMTLTVPSGAMSSSQTLRIRHTTGTSPVSPSAIGPVFELRGLPAASSVGTVGITTAGNPPAAQSTYLVVERADGSQVFVKARVQGNAITALLPPQTVASAASVVTAPHAAALSPQAETSTDDSNALLLYFLTGIIQTTSPKGYFHATTVEISTSMQNKVLTGLDAALEQLMAMGFEDKIRRQLPFAVQVARGKSLLAEDFGAVQDSVEYLEAGGQISWWPRKTIRVDTSYLFPGVQADELAVLGADDLMRVKAGHVLFHLVQQLYDTDNRKALAAAEKKHPWDWWDEANALVFERRLAGVASYLPHDANMSFEFKRPFSSVFGGGLDGAVAGQLESQSGLWQYRVGRYRGAALAPFLEYILSKGGNLQWIGNTYVDLDFLTSSFVPSQGLVREMQPTTLADYWWEFIRYVGGGQRFLGRPQSDDLSTGHYDDQLFYPLQVLLEDDHLTDTQSWAAPDFSAKFYEVWLYPSYGKPGFPAGTRLKITITGANGFVRKIVNWRLSDLVGTPGTSFDIAGVDQLQASNTRLLIGVANTHVSDQQPHSDNLSVQFSIVLPSGCPIPRTQSGMNAAAAISSCGVSGGLDETAKAAWISHLASEGTTASVDGGTISLSINPDRTGTISPTVQYQCTTRDSAGNDFHKVIDYQLSVTSCYADMTHCSGRYIANGYDIYNGKRTTYRESTSGWTVDLQPDGTYLFKLPNGQPPSWGDIPYRLR